MPTLEERVAYLEGKVEEHSRAWEDLKDLIIHLDGKIDGLDQRLTSRIDALDQRLSSRIDALDQRLSGRIDALGGRIDALGGRIDALDGRINALDQKFSRFFLWVIGIQVSILLAVIAALLR